MKLNKSFLLNTALTISLSTFTALSANAKEVNNYASDRINEIHTEIKSVLAADSQGKDHSSKNSAQGFISKHTSAMEFTFAILIVIGGMIVSERFNRHQEQLATVENNEHKH